MVFCHLCQKKKREIKEDIHIKDKPKTNKIDYLQGVGREWKEGRIRTGQNG